MPRSLCFDIWPGRSVSGFSFSSMKLKLALGFKNSFIKKNLLLFDHFSAISFFLVFTKDNLVTFFLWNQSYSLLLHSLTGKVTLILYHFLLVT